MRSPIQLSDGMKKLAFEARFMTKLTGMYESLMDALVEVRDLAREVRENGQRIRTLPPGPQGKQGERGPKGLDGKGKDGRDGINGIGRDGRDAPALEEVVRAVSAQIRQPENGKDAVFNIDELTETLLLKFLENKKFDWRKIPGLENEMASYRNQLAGKIYGKDTWARGGGDTVSAGSNITLTRLSNGTVQISSTGGSGGGGFDTITVNGTINDSNLIFTAITQPKLLNINGAEYLPTGGAITWTYIAGTITLSKPVGDNGAIFGISGSAGGGAVFYVPTGAVNAVNTVFGVTAQPTSVIADGTTYFEGAGYSYAALNVTMNIAPSFSIRYTL